MGRRVTIALAALVAAVTVLTSAAPAAAHGKGHHRNNDEGRGNLVFVQLNNINGNAVRVFERANDGTLTQVTPDFPTGGNGGTIVNAPTDPLASQGSLVFSNGLLFAVNAGSNSVSVFHVDGPDLGEPDQVIDSGGQFPVSIAVQDDLVFVVNAGGTGAIQGYRIVNGMLEMIEDSNRSLGLNNATPPENFGVTPGQVGINPNGQWVFVTMKNFPSGNGIINAFRIKHDGSLSAEPVPSPSVAGTPFGFTFQTPNRLIVAEAGVSAVTTYKRVGQGSLREIGSAPNQQAALCWIQQVGEFYFTTNTGSSTISSYQVEPNGQPMVLNPVAANTLTNAPMGTERAQPIDMTASGGFLYVQISAGGLIQVYKVKSNGALKFIANVDGLPIFPPPPNDPTRTGMEGIAAS